MPDLQDNRINVEDLTAREKDFRKVQLICFFGLLLPLFLVCTMGWLIAVMVTCRKIPEQLLASSFADDVAAPPTTDTAFRSGEVTADFVVSDLSLFIDNHVTALFTFCGFACEPPSSNASRNFLYAVNDSLVDGTSYKRNVTLASASMGFKCDYIASNISLEGHYFHSPATLFSVESGKAAAVNMTLASVPMEVSLSLQSSVSSLQVWNHSRSINMSLLGPVYMESVSGDVIITNSTELLAINLSSSNAVVYTTGRASIYWSNTAPIVSLQSLVLLVAYNGTTTAGPYLICVPIKALIQGAATPVTLSLTNRGLSGSVTLTYHENGQPVSFSEASLTSVRCSSFDIPYQDTLYTVAPSCQFGSINVVIAQDSQPNDPSNTTKVITVHNNGQVDLHLYQIGDELPEPCFVQSKIH
ncbi:hypothetical protein GL50803_0011752 [Giardia duodenalis]|uniref:Uncharacterized protein n=1 Tax=Giardia intestinalis (strain ATCC 50803 / WB clone C6) TaxID=184922 RepID=A8B8U2_GIAIC|nr:hypothetical protein GL50803_0011752 [Giardia intestinalis]KAE8302391.1 hypothetical protein GL50803_0011752 [Giardia intestinalis]|eukprot:XP_001708688.1 Hypothetical protein GL50803_11752 [Giardia lamblia ATCC 50803]